MRENIYVKAQTAVECLQVRRRTSQCRAAPHSAHAMAAIAAASLADRCTAPACLQLNVNKLAKIAKIDPELVAMVKELAASLDGAHKGQELDAHHAMSDHGDALGPRCREGRWEEKGTVSERESSSFPGVAAAR